MRTSALPASATCDECHPMRYDNYPHRGESISVAVRIEAEIRLDGPVIEWYLPPMMVWIVYLEDEPGFIGAFDIEEDAYEFQEKYAAESGRSVLLTPVALPYRQRSLRGSLRKELSDNSGNQASTTSANSGQTSQHPEGPQG